MFTDKTLHRIAVLAVLLAGLLCLLGAKKKAPEPMGPQPMGIIPGTTMSRDEFRARANAQLSAVALNALSYHLVEGNFPPDLATLIASDAWVLDVHNMFHDRRVQGIIFDPQPGDYTTAPYLGLTLYTDMPSEAPVQSRRDQQGNLDLQGTLADALQRGQNKGTPRIDPKAIRDHTGGDIFYFTQNDMLQLIMYAPDGTYIEWVEVSTNQNLVRRLGIVRGGPLWPTGQYAAEVLYYLERMLPQHYNMMLFMASKEPLEEVSLTATPAARRIEMAKELDIDVRNPYTRMALGVGTQYSLGDIYEPDAAQPSPLKIGVPPQGALTLEQLIAQPGAEKKAPPKKGAYGREAKKPRKPGAP